MTVINFPGGPTDRFRGEVNLRFELVRRGFTIAGCNPADQLGRGGNACSLGARVRHAGMDIEACRRLGPNNMLGLPPDRFDIWGAFDNKGQQTQRDKWWEYGISYRSYEGALAFMNWRQCHTVFALTPYGAPNIWIATIPHVENSPRTGDDEQFIVRVQDLPTLDQWIEDYRPYWMGRWGCPPGLAA